MTDHIQEAADVIADWSETFNVPIAAALAAAGLLTTPLERAVLDAADKWRDWVPARPARPGTQRDAALVAAVDALRAATPKDAS